MAGLWITDHARQRQLLQESGLFAVGVPTPEEVYLVAGLAVALIANKSARLIEIAQRIMAAHPCAFSVLWRGEPLQQVLP